MTLHWKFKDSGNYTVRIKIIYLYTRIIKTYKWVLSEYYLRVRKGIGCQKYEGAFDKWQHFSLAMDDYVDVSFVWNHSAARRFLYSFLCPLSIYVGFYNVKKK